MSGADLSPVGEAFRLPISGSTTLNATIVGSLATLVDTTVEVTLQQFAGRLGSVPISLQQPSVTLSYGPRGLILDETAFDIGESVVEFAGRLMPDGTGILTTHMRGGTDDLRAVFSAIADTQEWLTDVELAGMFTLDATASGPLDAPVVSGRLQVNDGRVSLGDQPPLDQIDLQASYGDGLVALDRLSAMLQGASVRASGMAPLGLWSNRVPTAPSPEDPARLRVEVESLTPATLAGYLDDATVAQLDGLVNATVVLESDAPTLDAVRATLTLDEAAVTISGIPLRQRGPTQITVENGRLQVSAFDWGNDEDYLTLGGFVELDADSGEPVVDLTVTGSLDLQALGAFTPGTAAEGQANLIANIQGPRSSPDVTGTIELSNAGLRVADPRLVVSALNGALFLTQDTVTVHELQGQLNGGDLDITGSLRRVGLRPEGTLTISGRQVALSIPDGLRTEVDADIEVTLLDGETMLTGTATIQRGDYRESMSLTGGLLSAIDRRQDVQTVGLEQTTPIDAIRLDLRVVTAEDIVLDNNYLDAALAADIRLGGTFGAPAVTGRVALLEGGRIRVGTRTYEVETGAIDFIDPTGIDPQVNIRAQTRASDYDITLSITGGQDTLTTTLQSDPPLPESDIVSLLLTGQTLSEASASPGTGARDQALGLISSEILGSAGRGLGLDVRVGEEFDTGGQVRFDSSLIANDVDPTTRLTVGRRLNDQLMVIVSQNLRENDRFSVVSYLVRDGIEVRVLFIDEVDRGYEVRHALEFGAPPTSERDITGPDRQRAVFTVAAVRFGGDTGYHVDRLTAETRLGPGDTFDFYRWQQDQDRLLRFYSDEGYREARITSRRTEGPGSDELTLDYAVTPGPLTRLVFEGDELPDAVRARLERAWELSVFDGFLMDEMRTIVDAELSADGFLRARVETKVEASADDTAKVVTVSVTRGPRTERREIAFTGNVALDDATLTALATTVVEENGWRNTEPLERALSALYRRRGLLEALVTVNPLVFDGPVARLPVRVDEGRVFTLATIGFEGASIRPAGELLELLGLATGTPYLETEAQTAVIRVELDYRQRGFNAARVTARSTIDVDTGEVDLVVVVREGRQEVLAEVVVEGGTRTNPTLVSNALRLTQGEPVILADWNLARKRLYDTGIFRTIDLRAETLDPDPLAERLAVSPIRARLVLEEWPAYSLRYGLRLDDLQVPEESKSTRDFGLGFAADASRRNLWGRGMTLGGAVRAAARGRVVRAYLRAPTFFGRSIRSSVFAQRGRDNMGEDESGFVEDLTSVTFEQRIQLPLDARTAYSASFDRVHTFEKVPVLPDFPFDISLNIVRFAGNTVLDRRDSLFDATRGWFHSSNVEYGFEPGVGEVNFAKYLAHQYHHWSVGPVVLATAGRLGLATGLGGDSLIPSERFFAGGANTVRGYAQDSLGPRSPIFDEAEGGNSLLIFNQEVRLPLFWRLGAVGFIDAGSVFETARDISVGDLAVGAGLGLRLLTPVGTLRLDYGFALTREEGDRLGRLHFALGQAF